MNKFAEKIATINEKSASYRNLTIDAPILYSYKGEVFRVAYFAGFSEDGDPKVFASGKTSITAAEFDVITLDPKSAVVMLIDDQYLQ